MTGVSWQNLSRTHCLARSRQKPGASSSASSAFEAWRDEQLAQEELEQQKLARKIAAEEDWMRYGVTRKAQAQCAARSRAARPAAGTPRPHGKSTGQAEIDAARGGGIRQRSGHRGQGHQQSLRRAGRSSMTSRLRVLRGDRVGFVGPNGSGKTTLVDHADRARLRPTAATCASAPTSRWRRSIRAAKASIRTVTLSEALTGGRGDYGLGRRSAPPRRPAT